jgi:hypothetical protein
MARHRSCTTGWDTIKADRARPISRDFDIEK